MSYPQQLADDALTAVEQQLGAVTEALRTGEPVALESAAQQLRSVSVAMSQTLGAAIAGGKLERPMADRVRRVAQQMNLQREQLARRSLLVERALATVLPHAPIGDGATYSRDAGPGKFGVAARLYAAQT
jgi:hypothetical protein